MQPTLPLARTSGKLQNPKHTQGTRRALLIGIVSGGDNVLKGTLNDVHNIRRFLMNHCGFLEENIVTLLETPGHDQPTKKHITDGFAKLIRESQPGDVNFIQFSGHGSRSDTNLYIIPCDFQQNGYIMDDRILKVRFSCVICCVVALVT